MSMATLSYVVSLVGGVRLLTNNIGLEDGSHAAIYCAPSDHARPHGRYRECRGAQAEEANADGDAIMTEASTFLIPLPFERDPEPQTMVPEKPSRGDSQQANTRAVKPTPMLPTVAKPESTSQIDTRFEATKVPLDLAIFHSIQASTTGAGAGGPDRLKKMLACILVVGGTALTPGMLGALDSR